VRLPKFPASTGRGTKSPVSRRDIPIQAGTGPGNEEEEAFNRYGIAGGYLSITNTHTQHVTSNYIYPHQKQLVLFSYLSDGNDLTRL
jgi:hypothetical protein